MNQERQIALVTGGARGIGAAICRALAEDGFTVAVADIDLASAAATAAGLPGKFHIAVAIDVSNESSVIAAFDAVEKQLGRASVLVSGAGVLLFKPDGSRPLIHELTLQDWQRTMSVNATGCFLTCREYVRRAPLSDPSGRVVTIASVAAQLGGYRSSAAYIASKAAVQSFTKAMARELAERSITVNCVAPGLIDAPMLRLSLDPANDEAAAAQIPLRRSALGLQGCWLSDRHDG